MRFNLFFRRTPLLKKFTSIAIGFPNISLPNPRRHLYICQKCFSRIVPRKSRNVTPVFLAAEEHLGRTAIIDQNGTFTYDDILHHSSLLSRKIAEVINVENEGNDGQRIAFLCENDMSYVVTQWAIWMLGAVGVPLCKSHPVSELEYFVEDSQSSLVVASNEYAEKIVPIADKLQIPAVILEPDEYIGEYEDGENNWFVAENPQGVTLRGKKGRLKGRYDDLLVTNQYKKQPAIIVYTSGTTGKPKGVVLTHGNLHAMMTGMISAWAWRRDDVILHVLPLHHVHGIVNVLMTPLFVGATCIMMPTFDPAKVWSQLLNPVANRISLFMAVPTIYAKLLEDYDSRMMRGRGSRLMRQYIKSVCRDRIRLMVSGSAALPQPIMERWEQVTGHRLLERYGMTEIGMGLTNPLNGPRIPGSVGNPFPGVEVCIAKSNVYSNHGYDLLAVGNSHGTTVINGAADEQGELMVRGPNVFSGYWDRPEETLQTFTPDGWFKTGDTAVFKNGAYSILGRTSVDVIKSGGYKISALYIERHLLAHPDITDCAVVGLPDITWGQKVAAILVLKLDREISQVQLKEWARDRLPPYQIPTIVKCLDHMPRNAMGKVNKKELVLAVFPDHFNRK